MKILPSSLLVVALLLSIGCSTYSRHDGYFWFWRDVDKSLMAKSDFNDDGKVTHEESARSRLDWAKSKGLLCDYRSRLHRDGRRLSAKEAARLFGLTD